MYISFIAKVVKYPYSYFGYSLCGKRMYANKLIYPGFYYLIKNQTGCPEITFHLKIQINKKTLI